MRVHLLRVGVSGGAICGEVSELMKPVGVSGGIRAKQWHETKGRV